MRAVWGASYRPWLRTSCAFLPKLLQSHANTSPAALPMPGARLVLAIVGVKRLSVYRPRL
ncbi:Protein of unknown function [Mycobacterium canettii CIPT 140070008]|nr:Protein of unknown function [Mycobacterium canettii CIPT 140070008]